jgi:hypothetical protein
MNRLLLLPPILLMLMSGCSTGRSMETDRNDPTYYQGRFPQPDPRLPASGQAVGAAVAAVTLSGKYYDKKGIQGQLLVKTKKDPFPTPCVNCTFMLSPLGGDREIQGQCDSQGKFRISAQAGIEYEFKPHCSSCSILSGKATGLASGDEVAITISGD